MCTKPIFAGLSLMLIVVVGCSPAPLPTGTPSPTPPPTHTPPPSITPPPVATATPPPTITVVVPSSFGGSGLQALVAYTDVALCEGSVPREFALNAQRSNSVEVKLACLKRLQRREAAAGEQQRTLYERGACQDQPIIYEGSAYNNTRATEIWALDDLVAGYLEVAGALAENGETDLAAEAYQIVIDHYACGWVYDLAGQTYFSGVEAARAGLGLLGAPG